MGGWLARGLTLGCQLLAVRILAQSLGIEGFAAYLIIASLQSWFLLADLGFGYAIQNQISRNRVSAELDDQRLGSGIVVLAGISVATILVVLALSVLLGPLLLRKFTSVSDAQAIMSIAVFAGLSVATGVANIAHRLLFADHRGYWAHLLMALAAVAGVIGLWIVQSTPFRSVIALSLLANYLPLLLLPAVALFLKTRAMLGRWPGLAVVCAQGVGTLGILWLKSRDFLIFAALSACVLNLDYVIVSQFLPAGDVVVYTIAAKVFGLFFVLFTSLTQAVWPQSAELVLGSDRVRLMKIIGVCICAGVMMVVGGSVTLLLFPVGISDLIAPGKGGAIPQTVVVALCFYWLVRVWCDTLSVIIMSTGDLRIMRFVVPAQAVLNAPLAILGTTMLGLEGLILGSMASFILTVAWVFPLEVKRVLARMSARGEFPLSSAENAPLP